jgi:hypothetical protein
MRPDSIWMKVQHDGSLQADRIQRVGVDVGGVSGALQYGRDGCTCSYLFMTHQLFHEGQNRTL